MVGEVVPVIFASRFASIRLVKQEDFCRAIGLIYFVENCLDLP